MGIKETPTNFRVYYTCMKEYYNKQKDEAGQIIDALTAEITRQKSDILAKEQAYKEEYHIVLSDYQEFVHNEYIDGTFFKVTQNYFTKNDHIEQDLWDLYDLAKKQKTIHDLRRDVEFYDKLTSLTIRQYTEILRTYYTEVQRQMILNGAGYVFEGSLGWICINRCKIDKQRTHIDFSKTKKKKAEIVANGGRLYNKEEAEWCKANGIEYNGQDGRVFLRNEYCYEIPLLDCHIPHGSKVRFVSADYRGNKLRGKTNEQLLEEADYNTESLCKLTLDIRTKLNLCVIADKTLYAKFIRNENQKPINASKASWKNRQ